MKIYYSDHLLVPLPHGHRFPMPKYALLHQRVRQAGFPGVEYYRLTDRGRDFADRVWQGWRARRPLERLVTRFTG